MALHTGQLNGIALCAGNGGIELGLKLLLGERYKTVCYVEREAYNAAALVARMDEKTLDRAPIWDDITTFDGRAWRGLVDIISAGFPCQPHSSAGKQKGVADERWLWDSIDRITGEILPGIVWLENVPNLAFSGLDRVLSSLTKAGYNSVWDTFSAEETGASQKRERLFIFSYANGFFDRRKQTERETWRNLISGSDGQNFWELFSDSDSCRCETRSERIRRAARTNTNRSSKKSELAFADKSVGITSGTRREKKNKIGTANAITDASNFVFPPFRDDYEGWGKYLAERPNLEPAILRSPDGIANRLDRLRTIGNGVVPLVVAYAFATLARTAYELNKNSMTSDIITSQDLANHVSSGKA